MKVLSSSSRNVRQFIKIDRGPVLVNWSFRVHLRVAPFHGAASLSLGGFRIATSNDAIFISRRLRVAIRSSSTLVVISAALDCSTVDGVGSVVVRLHIMNHIEFRGEHRGLLRSP
jgi:hypothetical protein